MADSDLDAWVRHVDDLVDDGVDPFVAMVEADNVHRVPVVVPPVQVALPFLE